MRELESLREQIDSLDKQLVSVLAERLSVVKKIATIKAQNNLQILDNDRWQQVLNNVIKQAEAQNIDSMFIQDIFNRIHEESQKVQNEQK